MSQNENNDLYIWKINGLELPFDGENLEDSEQAYKAFEKMGASEKAMKKDVDIFVTVRAYCDLYFTCMSDIFGTETAEKIFSGVRYNARKCEEIYDSFMDFLHAQNKAQTQRYIQRSKKYAPISPNREQRRVQAKK